MTAHVLATALLFIIAGLPFAAQADDRRTTASSPVADAAEQHAVATVRQLLASGADVRAAQVDGTTALHWAVYHDDLELVDHMLAHRPLVDASNRYGVTPLHLACRNGHPTILARLLDSGASVSNELVGGETPLMTASRTGNAEVVKLLLDHGADVRVGDRRGQTALMWAASEGHLETVKTLLAAGAEGDQRLKSGFSPLFFAVRAGRIEVADWLIKSGADIHQVLTPEGGDKAPRKGSSPIIVAVENGHFELAVMLVDRGADPNDQRSGTSPLHMLSWVRKPNRGDGDDGDPAPLGSGRLDSLQFVREMQRRGANVNLQLERGETGRGKLTRKGATPFMMASITADLPLMKLLVELGANPLTPNADGSTPVMATAGLGALAPGEEAGTESETLECLEYHLQLGADLNTTDSRGETAMHGAAYKNFPKVVAALAQHGARIEVWNRCNAYGWTPLSIAQGTRVGNFKPSPDTIAAIEQLLTTAGVQPAKPTAAAVDPYVAQSKPAPYSTQAAAIGQTKNSQPGDSATGDSQLARTLKAIVAQQQDQWNAGDIPAFMEAYWRDPQLTFSAGGKVARGWEAIRDRYLSRYPDKKTMGQLQFSDLEVQALSDEVALMLGRWQLTREQPVGGAFSLVWRKIDGRWWIVHDHSSSDAP